MKTKILECLVREVIRETLQQLNEVENGEWWIYPGGSSEFCDRDIGDSGHDGVVISYLAREIYEHFLGGSVDEMGYLSEYEDDLKQSLLTDGRLDQKELNIWERGRGPTEILAKKLVEDKVFSDSKQAIEAVFIAWGSSSTDPRDYAMKYLGWKRMTTSRSTTHLQTWFLRQSDMEDMRRGIFDAWGDMGDDDGNNSEHTVTVEVRANNKVFADIPLETFERASVRDIVTYERGLAWMREKASPKIDPVNFTQMG